MSENRDTREVIRRLREEGWIERQGKGDHLNFRKEGSPRLITIDTGKKEIAKPIYGKVAKIAGWR
jgi:predicted RNA binding protein YcfA (HicA-like mRNA interferase family)